MIEERLQIDGHLAPRAFAAEAPHLGEDESLDLSQTPPERGTAACMTRRYPDCWCLRLPGKESAPRATGMVMV